MPETTTLLTYLLIVLGFVFIPGPATLLTIARASISGTRAGIATGAGIAVGDLVHTLMAIVGVSAIIAASATLFSVVKYVGAAYLVYLGLRAIFSRTEAESPQSAAAMPVKQAFYQAALTEILNPKTALFFLAFMPQFVKPEAGSVALQLAILGVLFVLLGFMSTVIFALTAGGLGKGLRQSTYFAKWKNRVSGSIYLFLGIRVAIQER